MIEERVRIAAGLNTQQTIVESKLESALVANDQGAKSSYGFYVSNSVLDRASFASQNVYRLVNEAANKIEIAIYKFAKGNKAKNDFVDAMNASGFDPEWAEKCAEKGSAPHTSTRCDGSEINTVYNNAWSKFSAARSDYFSTMKTAASSMQTGVNGNLDAYFQSNFDAEEMLQDRLVAAMNTYRAQIGSYFPGFSAYESRDRARTSTGGLYVGSVGANFVIESYELGFQDIVAATMLMHEDQDRKSVCRERE